MKPQIYKILLLATALIVGCKTVSPLTSYTGVIVEQNSMTPLVGLQICITDGVNVYSEVTTDESGHFSIDAHNDCFGQTYLYINGNGLYPSKKIELISTEEDRYDYGLIYLYNQTDISLFPEVKNVFFAYSNESKSTHINDVLISSPLPLKETYVEVSRYSNLARSKRYRLDKQANGKYSCVIDDLIVGDAYYFQIVAINNIGTGKSEIYSRTVGVAIPEIVGLESATINSAIISIKISEEPVETLSSGICWSISDNPTIADHYAYASSNLSAHITMSELDFSQHSYYVRAFAQNVNGISYSEVLELPINNPYNLPTFKHEDSTYSYVYVGKDYWLLAHAICESFVLVFDDWTLPNVHIIGSLINAYYAENGEMVPLPMWSMRSDVYMESGESKTFLMTTNGIVMWPKNEQHHYFAIRKIE